MKSMLIYNFEKIDKGIISIRSEAKTKVSIKHEFVKIFIASLPVFSEKSKGSIKN